MMNRGLGRSPSWSAVVRYVLAFAAGLFATALRFWLTPLLGTHNAYHTAWAAVVFSAWYCGFGPSILTTLTSLSGVYLWLLTYNRSQLVMDRTEAAGVLGFLIFSSVIIAFGESTRRARARRDRTEQSLRESEMQLKLANRNMQREIELRTAELERKTAQTVNQAQFLNRANDAIFVRNSDGRISYWNEGAERLYGWTREEALGQLTHELLHSVLPVPLSEIAKADRWEGELRQTRRDGAAIVVASRWTTLRDQDGNFAGWLEINTDITARKRAEDAARRLSGRLLSLQDDERRRIARELHDSLGQYLAIVKVNLDLLARTVNDPQQTILLTDCLNSAEQCLKETRTISHLLHPPLLDEAGFASAARWYVEGFAQRSDFQVDLEFPSELDRLDRDVETALFRVLQEALTNVHRHSGASSVHVVLRVDAEAVQLEITDNGRGIPQDLLYRWVNDGTAAGVGLAGMRERVRELGGSLTIAPTFPGTSVTATIPLVNGAGRLHEESNRGASAA